jgi:hypothetical protein
MRKAIGCRYEVPLDRSKLRRSHSVPIIPKTTQTSPRKAWVRCKSANQDYFITVVSDRDNPAIAYLHKGKTTYSVNIDRENPRRHAGRLPACGSALLSAGFPSSPYAPWQLTCCGFQRGAAARRFFCWYAPVKDKNNASSKHGDMSGTG